MTQFSDLGLIAPILDAVAAEGYETATPIQAAAIPLVLAGRDVLGLAQTGTGKTAAFALPILQRLTEDKKRAPARSARALILTPTRELAVQIAEGFSTYGRNLALRRATVFGGVGQNPQVKALLHGLDVLVATPGRLLDLMDQGHARLDGVEILVLDEADRMFDMGFAPAIKKIVAKLPAKRQTLLFSATMPDAVSGLAASVLHRHERIEVTPPATTAEKIEQRVMFVAKDDKRHLLVELLSGVERAIIFTRTKHGANRVAEQLAKNGVPADAIHGNKSQNARQKALGAFKTGEVRALVATDIAARGIDIDGVTHVINFELPNEPESYVHRIGRTARAGAEGVAVSLVDAEELAYLKAIEKTIRQTVPMDTDHAWHADAVARLHLSGARVPKPPARGGLGARPQGRPHGQGRPQNRPQGQGRQQAQSRGQR